MQLWLPIAISIVYLLAAHAFWRTSRARFNPLWALGLMVLACQGHALVLIGQVGEGEAINLSIVNVLSIYGWAVACLSVIWLWRANVALAGVMICLLNALLIVLPLLFPTQKAFMANLDQGMLWHILSSIAAWTVLSVALINALLYGWMFHRLKQRQLSRHNPMALIGFERMMVWFSVIGFLLLSLSLFSGWLFVEDLFAQHLWHKTLFTILAWVVYGWLCFVYFIMHQRGMRVVYINFLGYGLLLTGYVISNIILQFIVR
ncbi:cytochrome c biogenesis protein CcsA [Suttonella sp. R2A3]|uniref:cytochrome C assembly family protein n=1 Tax=Suttonella sp. R2A3 TaxID=2908648 RepID=UPI001F1A7B66|nr:cytochrome c biogenesis protein CcsA [Suttonella sp. R2A3]UJF24354.1 cytochrome c biogenesis protein CcsA [Suttonella sp. R2A3]